MIAINMGVPTFFMPSLVSSIETAYLGGGSLNDLKQDPENSSKYEAMSYFDYVRAELSWQLTELIYYNGNGSLGPEFDSEWGSNTSESGFEVMLPNTTPLNISWEITASMWDFHGEYSWVNWRAMIEYWVPASEGDDTAINVLETALSLNKSQVMAMAAFVYRWRNNYMDHFMFLLTGGRSVTSVGLEMFYQSWATSGTYCIRHFWGPDYSENFNVNAISYDTGSFDLDNYSIDLSSFWGLGLEFCPESVTDLFDVDNPKSLVNTNGIELWHTAQCDKSSGAYNDLLTHFNIDTVTLDAILRWLPEFEKIFGLSTADCPEFETPLIPGYDTLVILGSTGVMLVFIFLKKKRNLLISKKNN
jgi:hypothetical protein